MTNETPEHLTDKQAKFLSLLQKYPIKNPQRIPAP